MDGNSDDGAYGLRLEVEQDFAIFRADDKDSMTDTDVTELSFLSCSPAMTIVQMTVTAFGIFADRPRLTSQKCAMTCVELSMHFVARKLSRLR